MIISIGLVVLVVFLFLRNGWATFIPSISVPVSLIGTFGAMYLLGYTLDNLSLMALTIATGFVVDDAIVVIENITRHIENGMTPMEAALKGAEEIGFTVLSMSISLIAVFIPILMMGGIVGRLFREFAVVLACAIAISMVVSLTATPMMCSRLLKARAQARIALPPDRTVLPVDHLHVRLGARCRAGPSRVRSCSAVLRHASASPSTSTSRFPRASSRSRIPGRLQGQVMGQQHISYQALVDKAKWFEEQVRADPDVEAVTMVAGGSGGGGGGQTRRR